MRVKQLNEGKHFPAVGWQKYKNSNARLQLQTTNIDYSCDRFDFYGMEIKLDNMI